MSTPIIDIKTGAPMQEQPQSLEKKLAEALIMFEQSTEELRRIAVERPNLLRTVRIPNGTGVDSVPSIIRRIQSDLNFIFIAAGQRK